MKKIFYILSLSILFISVSESAKANMEVIVGPTGPQVVTNTAVPSSYGPTVGGSGTMNGGTIGGVYGSYAVIPINTGGSVSNVGREVTNVVVCHSFCANGTFGPGGDTVAMQVPNSGASVFFGPGTTFYNGDTKTFTVYDPNLYEITQEDNESSSTVYGKKILTFTSGGLSFDSETGTIGTNNGGLSFNEDTKKFSGITETWADDSQATISVTSDSISESLFLNSRKSNNEIINTSQSSGLLLINEKIQTLISLLGSWVK